MPILGTPTSVILLIAVAVVLAIGLPLIFGLKFDWDPQRTTDTVVDEENE